MAFRRRDVKKASYYVWFLGARESAGLRGEQYILPALQQLLHQERLGEPCKVTLQCSSKGLKILQNIPRVREAKPTTVKHVIPASSITCAMQSEDLVCVILLLYNPVTGCPVHVHAYRCDSFHTAFGLRTQLQTFIDRPENQRKFTEIESRLAAKGLLAEQQLIKHTKKIHGISATNAGKSALNSLSDLACKMSKNRVNGNTLNSEGRSEEESEDSGGYSRSSGSPDRPSAISDRLDIVDGKGQDMIPNPMVAVMYESLAAELKAKLGNPEVAPILLPPRDYDTVCRKQGKLIEHEKRKCTNELLIGGTALESSKRKEANVKSSIKLSSEKHKDKTTKNVQTAKDASKDNQKAISTTTKRQPLVNTEKYTALKQMDEVQGRSSNRQIPLPVTLQPNCRSRVLSDDKLKLSVAPVKPDRKSLEKCKNEEKSKKKLEEEKKPVQTNKLITQNGLRQLSCNLANKIRQTLIGSGGGSSSSNSKLTPQLIRHQMLHSSHPDLRPNEPLSLVKTPKNRMNLKSNCKSQPQLQTSRPVVVQPISRTQVHVSRLEMLERNEKLSSASSGQSASSGIGSGRLNGLEDELGFGSTDEELEEHLLLRGTNTNAWRSRRLAVRGINSGLLEDGLDEDEYFINDELELDERRLGSSDEEQPSAICYDDNLMPKIQNIRPPEKKRAPSAESGVPLQKKRDVPSVEMENVRQLRRSETCLASSSQPANLHAVRRGQSAIKAPLDPQKLLNSDIPHMFYFPHVPRGERNIPGIRVDLRRQKSTPSLATGKPLKMPLMISNRPIHASAQHLQLQNPIPFRLPRRTSGYPSIY